LRTQNLKETNTNAKLQSLSKKNYQQETRTQKLETNTNAKLQSLSKNNSQQDLRTQKLETNINTKLKSLADTLKKIETKLSSKSQLTMLDKILPIMNTAISVN
jgi:hypothetical protein